MLKFIFMMLFMFPLSFLKNFYWTVQNLIFLLTFLFMINLSSLNYFNYISYYFGLDMISYGLILLSFWICGLMLMASEKVFTYNNYEKLFIFMILFLLLMLVLTFSSMSVFMFYLFFEASLIPTLFLILGWGYQPERLQAGVYLLFYTLLASLPLLIGIFYILNFMNTLSFTLLLNLSFMNMNLLYLSLIFAFLVKMPMFLVHLWLPKAHVEAPVSGSMILAGILLKLGGYGLLRMFSLLQISGVKYNYWWISVSLVGGVLISLVCLRQTDLKALIAYSSVAHMGIVLSGLLTMTYWGLTGSYALMIAHGLCSSGLFCLANISYERMGSRSLLINKGLLNFMPTLSLWWFLLCSGNMAAPPTLNLLGEISLLNSIVSWSWVTMIMLAFLSFFSAAYSLYLFAYSQHGKVYSGVYFFSVGTIREFLLLMLHWLPLNLLILKSSFCMLWI
uniref:NADH-ubiquinone oxidoreductase chain 4 n=2 Tax=Laticorn TaxID=58247 RepID=A0A411ADM5_ANOSI|nr:NADH dehydrogenase subunit 4 [Anopheles belenrae]QAX27179.1 NADH dehydrogenase subunit 4 [Anopheles sinensis]QII41654.1 NADH dehydrogenase subunit 4 [Anopheles sinensis]QII41680.1 NADH dehydrogenase subunit 4 [Anopheles sinensis]QII41690.1 NADH dehydrogenase subunit 4 [Anopheles sinensis]QII41718.1 NADH dehydrogenase subunit 4 [Anopheles sinensis]